MLPRCLSTLEIDRPIPIAAVAGVAQILAHLYRPDRALQGEAR